MLDAQKQADLNVLDKSGRTPLHLATGAYNGLEVVKYLIDAKEVSLNVHDNNGRTILHDAALSGNLELVKYLIDEKEVSLNVPDNNGRTILHDAAFSGNLELVEYLIGKKEVSLNVLDNNGRTPLSLAASAYNGLEVVKYLIDAKEVSLNVHDNNGRTILHDAALSGNLELVKYLIDEKEVSLNVPDNNGRTILHLAAFSSNLELVEYLIGKKEVSLNVLDNNGRTILHEAAFSGNLELVEYLIGKKEVDLNVPDNNGRTILHEAAFSGNLELVEYLIGKKEVNVNVPDNNGRTPLHLAAFFGNLELVEYLIGKKEVDLNAPDNNGRTILHEAAFSGNLDLVKYLIDKKEVNLSVFNEEKETPLHEAASAYNGLEVVKYLIDEKQVDLNAIDTFGRTCLDTAALCGRGAIVNFLLKRVKDKSQELDKFLFGTSECEITPLHYAILNDHKQVVNILLDEMKKNQENLKDLIFGKENRIKEIDFSDHDLVRKFLLETAIGTFTKNKVAIILYEAIRGRKIEIIKFTLDKIKEKYPQNFSQYIDGQIQDTKGYTSLMWAAKNGEKDIAKLLLESGATVNMQNDNSETALHLAVKNSHQEIVQLLLDKQQEPLGLVKSEECLPSISSGSSGRRKREAKECLFTWEDVDEFNEGRDEKRDFSKIKIDSEKFIDYIKSQSMSEVKLAQLVQLADKVPVIGKSQNLVSKLINNQKVINHLGKVGRVSGMVMHGMMAKNVLADFLNGNYQGVAINLGFIAGGKGFAKVAEAASLKGTELISGGKLFLGRSLRAASPFLARGTSAFIAYDLVNQIKEYKKGNNDALVGIIGDSIYLGVDVGEVGIEVAEGFGLLEGVSSVTGPIGATIGAVVFVGTDVYLAVKRVDKIDEMIHLTTKERFIEGFYAFIGIQPEQHIERLIEEKQVNTQLVNQGLEYLKNNNNIQRYIFPTGRSVTDSCHTVQYRERCPYTGLNICYGDGSGGLFVIKKREECTTKLQIDLDSTVLLDIRRTNIKWSRARPSDSGGEKFVCLPQGSYESVPSMGAYLCKNAIGIEYTNNRTENNTLISLGKGNDTIVGFPHGEHIVVLDDGCKNVTLGDGNDTVFLKGNNITGIIRGGSGINTLDLENFAEKEKSIHVSLLKMFGYLYYEKGNEISGILGIHEINDILLRNGKQDRVYTDCNTKYVDGRGGESHNSRDNIIILNDNCAHEMKVIVRPYTDINNCAVNGSFTYIVPMANKGEAFVNSAIRTDQQSNHKFIFNYTLYDVNNIESINNTVSFSFISNVGYLRFEPREVNDRYTTDYEFNITNNAANSSLYQLSDGTEIKVGEKNLYAVQSTNSSVDEIINDYSTIANNLKMSIFVQSLLNNETVAIGHGNHDVLNNNPDHKSHLVGNGGENIFVVTCGHETMDESKLPIPEVVIYDVDKENLIDTLDLRQIKQQVSTDLNKEVKAKVIVSNTDLIIELLCGEDNQSIVKLRLKDALVTNWHERLHTIIDNVPMKIEEFELKPLPLIFDESDKNIIVIRPQDIEEGSKIVISKEMDNYIFARLGNDLIITNAFDRNLTGNEFCTISLNKFYQEEKMKTLTIKFADQEIVLKDHQVQVDTARDIDAVKREKKEQVYNDVFNNTRNEIIEANETITRNKLHQRSRRAINEEREENATSSATRLGSKVNDLFSWVKRSVSGLFYSRAALSKNVLDTESSMPQVDKQFASVSNGSSDRSLDTEEIIKYKLKCRKDIQNSTRSNSTGQKQEGKHDFTNGDFFRDNVDYVNANLKQMRERQTPVKFKPSGENIILEMGDYYLSQTDFNGTMTLLDTLIRKLKTGEKHVSTQVKDISGQEALNYGLKITQECEKIVEQAALRSGISMHRLNIDFVEMQKEVTKKIMGDKFDEISGIVKSYIEKACPGGEAGCPGKLSPKKFDKFIAQFSKGLLNQSIHQMLHNENNALKMDNIKEPQSLGLSGPRTRLDDVLIAGNPRELVAGRR